MSRKTSAVVGGQTGAAVQYNFLRDEARGASWLLAYGTSTLKVQINAGLVYFKEGVVEFAGGLSPVLTEPTASSRIDVVSMASSAEIVVTVGVEADTPTAPSVPADHMPICEVYNKAGQVEITDEEENGEGYISKDLRIFLRLPKLASLTVKGISEEATAAEINAGTQAGGTGAQLVINPKYLKDSEYYTQRPTANEKAALAGEGTPAAGNPYVCKDAAVLDTGNQTIAGVKTFSSIPVLPGSNPTTANQATRKAYVDAAIDNILGAWAAATVGSSTQVSTAGFLVGYHRTVAGSEIAIKTDSSDPPTTVRAEVESLVNDDVVSFCVPVRKDHYYLIEYTNGASGITAYWIPLT